MIDKVPFDGGIKKLFRKKLTQEFYDQHKSFLSNPLLSIMMLMTFKENMDIPKSMNIFYDQAFTTLFTWHDATKSFSRKKTLDIDEFRKSFAVFCLLSYYEQKYEFSETEIFSYLRKTDKVLNQRVKENKLLSDYVEAVNLMQQDGLQYVFIHRSFQEYFAAFALVSILHDKIGLFLEGISGRTQDNVIQIAFEMNPELLTKAYLEPNFTKYIQNLSKKDPSDGPYKLASEVGVSYLFVQNKRSDLKGGSTTLYIEHRSGIFDFIVMIQKIKEMIIGVAELPAFGPETGALHLQLGKTVRALGVMEEVSVRVSFAPADLGYELTSKHTPEVVKRIVAALASGSPAIRTAAMPVVQKLRRDVESVRKWSEDRIADSQRRDKSIDAILGIS